ncbi:Nuclear factor related to kappa-B-binding protein DNA-binding protein R kappa-B [Collichthys lucidus]|uniref:Nuclear factor related to kappa-B-binding protein n=1 Tax=Collichthys lucidus TaxID=240159 RepID=A0A4U5V6Q6_COLLU|nr:Nuclear factor related to kappa-B-binding protein DNA-binding protein R kappa-B [Collichthys lucidus]
MDALTQMLTDPLDPKEENYGQITEECLLGNCTVNLPEDLLEDPEIFFSVMSESTWSEVLSDSQRQHLRQFLPQFPNTNVAEQDSIVSDLFNNRDFNFGNPLHLAQKLFRDGYFNPEVVKYRQLCGKSQRKRQLYCLQQYCHRLLKQILVSRKELLEFAVHNGQDFPPKKKLPSKTHAEMRETRVRRRLSRILKEVKSECGDGNASSDDDDISLWTPGPQSPSSPTPTVSLRVLPSLSTLDMKTNALFDLSLPKRKIKDERRKKKMRTIKVESEDPCESLTPSDTPSAPPANIINSLPDPPSAPLPNIKEEIVEECQSSPVVVEEMAVSFFSLLETILKAEHLSSTSTLEDKVHMWQSSPASSLNVWFSSVPCWSDLVLQALQFLAGETKDGMMALPSGFSPFVEFSDESQQWRWIGPTQDTEKDLSALCQLWLDSKDLVVKEQQRYNQPHKAFTFRMHGFESVVGPVKGVFDKEMSLNKAREHTLLRSDRPPYVTILSLVRDAAARLPNGEGTRAEICELLKDSQFLAPDVTSAQVNTVVSGALDRLHYEKDPCVKYDIGRKLWIYLHRSRSQEEFAFSLCLPPRCPNWEPSYPAVRPVHRPQQSVTSQNAARIVSHLAAGSLPQVRVVSSHPGLSSLAGSQQATLVHQTSHQIRMPVSVAAKGISQAVVSVPLRSQSASSPLQVTTTQSVSAVAKPQTGSPSSPVNNPASPAVLQGVTSPNIQTDAKGQTVLRITPDMMATLAKSPVATVKLTPDFLSTATSGSKSISATLHVTPPHPSPSLASATSCAGEVQTTKAGSTLLKAAGDTAIRLMPTLAVTVGDQKSKNFTTVSSPDKSGATIRIMPGLGVIPQKQGSPLTLGTATATVRQVPATVVTTQTGKLPARITVPLSVLNQPLKSKSVVTTPLVKGSLNTNISTLGRNIILTTMPAGTKLIAGNKPVSFVTAQQFQQLQQQGQATQVRIQTVQAQQLQQHMATGSPKSVSTVVVTTAPSPKCAPDPPPAPQQ